jgi:hypothetical protein
MFDLTKLVDALRLPTKTFGALAVASGAIIFCSQPLLAMVGLAKFRDDFRPYIGVAFVLSVSFLFVALVSAVWVGAAKRVRHYRLIRAGQQRLRNLNSQERSILGFYIARQTRSQTLDIKSGAVNALVKEGIIARGSSLGTIYGFDYIIQPWAWDYLNKNMHLLGAPDPQVAFDEE